MHQSVLSFYIYVIDELDTNLFQSILKEENYLCIFHAFKLTFKSDVAHETCFE